MRKLRSEDGSALMMALLVLFVALGLGIALMATAESGQRSAGNEQGAESAYALAEAALNAQVFELSVRWPTKGDSPSPTTSPNYGYPYSCNASSTASTASYCPTSADLSTAYPVSSGTCPAGTQGDGWNNSSSVSNGWTTYVRDAGPSTASSSQLFNSSFEETQPYYDATGSANPNAGGAVWVRAVGTVNCHTAVVVTKVADQIVGLNFPNYVLNANSFTISNNGSNKDIINTQDTTGVTSAISLRCAGDGGLPPSPTCAGEQNPNQIQPTTTYTASPAPTPTLSAGQLALAKNLAIADNTYFPPGSCPTSETQLQGNPVYVDGTNSQPCTLKFQGQGVINTLASPGLLIIVNGTLDFEGGETFYGVIYGANQGGLSTPVVTLGGTSTVVGGLAVDGSASLTLGSSGNGAVNCTDTSRTQKCGDLEYLSAAFNGVLGFAGADPVPNTFRQLPAGQ